MASSQMSLLLVTLLALAASTSAIPTIYELVNQFGFPSGIVPDSVESYVANDADGTFVIYLKKPCYVKYEYLVYFDTVISGKISYGLITDVKGLQAQSFGFWLNIDEIEVVGSSLKFTLGYVSVKSDIELFVPIPTCKDKALAACDHSSNIVSKEPKKGKSMPPPLSKGKGMPPPLSKGKGMPPPLSKGKDMPPPLSKPAKSDGGKQKIKLPRKAGDIERVIMKVA